MNKDDTYNQLKGDGTPCDLIGVSCVVPGVRIEMGASTRQDHDIHGLKVRLKCSDAIPENMVVVTSRQITDQLIESRKKQVVEALKQSSIIIMLDEVHDGSCFEGDLPFSEEPVPVPPKSDSLKVEPKRFGKKHREQTIFTGRGR